MGFRRFQQHHVHTHRFVEIHEEGCPEEHSGRLCAITCTCPQVGMIEMLGCGRNIAPHTFQDVLIYAVREANAGITKYRRELGV